VRLDQIRMQISG